MTINAIFPLTTIANHVTTIPTTTALKPSCQPNRKGFGMALVYDSLGFSKRLVGAGYSREQADATAEAVRDFVMVELVTKTELQAALSAQTLQLTIRFGSIVVVGMSLLFAALKLT